MFKRDNLLAIGGFDPSWYHAEDMEVSLKLIQAGGIIVYTPNAVVITYQNRPRDFWET